MAMLKAAGGVLETGNPELDKKLGGGVPVGSLILIEGQSDAGKSVFTQQLAWGSARVLVRCPAPADGAGGRPVRGAGAGGLAARAAGGVEG